jgi:hypothetical protein
MASNDVKRDLTIMNQLHQKLSQLDEESARKVLNDLLMIFTKDSDNSIGENLKALGYCITKLEKLERHEGEAIVQFLVDRYFLISAHKQTVYTLSDNPLTGKEFDPFSELTQTEEPAIEGKDLEAMEAVF